MSASVQTARTGKSESGGTKGLGNPSPPHKTLLRGERVAARGLRGRSWPGGLRRQRPRPCDECVGDRRGLFDWNSVRRIRDYNNGDTFATELVHQLVRRRSRPIGVVGGLQVEQRCGSGSPGPCCGVPIRVASCMARTSGLKPVK